MMIGTQRYTARDNKDQLDKQVVRQVETAFKITILSVRLTWVIHGVDFSKCQPLIKTEFDLLQLCKTLKESNLIPSIPETRTGADWAREQQ